MYVNLYQDIQWEKKKNIIKCHITCVHLRQILIILFCFVFVCVFFFGGGGGVFEADNTM